jgi:hypothetical protein
MREALALDVFLHSVKDEGRQVLLNTAEVAAERGIGIARRLLS